MSAKFKELHLYKGMLFSPRIIRSWDKTTKELKWAEQVNLLEWGSGNIKKKKIRAKSKMRDWLKEGPQNNISDKIMKIILIRDELSGDKDKNVKKKNENW